MTFYSRVSIDIATNKILEKDEFHWSGEVAYCKGATDQEKATSASQAAFMGQLQQAFYSQFSGQGAILASLKQAFSPILSAGVGQYGFTPQEDAALRTQSDTGTAQGYRSARAAAGEALAAQGSGNQFLPSSTKAGIMSGIATDFAQQQAGNQLDITRAGYDVGRQNFYKAANALAGGPDSVASLMNPLGYSSAATSAGKSAFDSEKAIQQADAAASPWSTIGGIIGGGLSAFASGYGTALGKKAGS